MKKILIVCCICSMALLACSKKKTGGFIIAGKILNKADSSPYASREITIFNERYQSGVTGERELSTVAKGSTDAAGNFEVLTDWHGAGSPYYLDDKDYSTVIYSKKNGERVDAGTVYK